MAVVIASWMPRAVRTRACQVGRAFSLLHGASGRLSLRAFCVMCVAALRCAALHQ